LVVSRLTLADEALGDTVVMKGKMLRNGTTEHSFTVEEDYTDITQILYYTGLVCQNFNAQIAAGSLTTGSMSFIGSGHGRDTATQGTGSPSAQTSTDVFNAVNNIQDVYEGGSALPATVEFLDASFDINTDLRARPAVGSLGPVGIGSTKRMITGGMNYYFESGSAGIYDKYLNDTESSLEYSLVDGAGNQYIITFPAIKYSTASITPGGNGVDTMVSTTFEAYKKSTLSYAIQIDAIDA